MGARTADPVRRQQNRKGWTAQQSVFWYRLAQFLVWVLFRLWVRHFRVVGVENVPPSGGAFLIANHTSGIDPFILGHAVGRRMLRGPGKVELFSNPFFGYIMRKIGMFPIRQEVADAAAVRTMVELYRNGRAVIIYPEGGRSETGELKAFFPDFARLVIKMKARVIPAGIAGAREVLPIGSLIPRPNSPVAVVVGEPFELSDFYGQELTAETLHRAAEILRDRVAELVTVARQERLSLNSRR